jgi:glutamyl-Q tRNA(Asp) synthetase
MVRGQDLADNTPRQILLQRALGLPTPRYRHTPLVRGRQRREAEQAKWRRRRWTPSDPLTALNAAAAAVLGLPPASGPLATALAFWAAAFGREAPVVLEIGFGMGEATAHIAA